MKIRLSAVLSRQLEFSTGDAECRYPVIFQDVKTVDFPSEMSIGECLSVVKQKFPGAILIEVAEVNSGV